MNEIDRPTKYNPVPAERKTEIIQDAMQRIAAGHTIKAIAKDHAVDPSSLNMWLLALGDEYRDLRNAVIDNKLSEAMEAIDSAGSVLDQAKEEKGEIGQVDISHAQFNLAHAREMFKSAAFIAERRDARYQPKPDQSNERVSVSFTISPPSNRDDSTHITIDSVLNRDSDEQT